MNFRWPAASSVARAVRSAGPPAPRRAATAALTPIDRVRMQSQLEEAMNLAEDQVMIIDLGPDEDQARQAATVLGPGLPPGDKGMVVV